MDLQDMHFALSIARHQNLTKAAQELYVSQPTLSKCLRKLEVEAGGKLFTRNNGRYCPTCLGEQYLEYARSVLALEKQWRQKAAAINAEDEGVLNVALPLMRSFCMAPQIVPAFRAVHPGFRLNLYEESIGIQKKLLLDTEIDFAIFNDPQPHPKLEYEPLAEEELVLVLPPNHRLAGTARGRAGRRWPWIDLALFAQEPFLLHFPEQNSGWMALELFRQYQIDPPVVFRTRSVENLLLLCRKEIGVCFSPENYVHAMQVDPPLVCCSIGEQGVFTTLQIAYRKGTTLSGPARDFIALARGCCLPPQPGVTKELAEIMKAI